MKSVFASALIGATALAMSAGFSVASNAPYSPAVSGDRLAQAHHYCTVCQYVPTGRKFCFNVVGLTEIDARASAAATCTLTTANPFYRKVHKGSCSHIKACR